MSMESYDVNGKTRQGYLALPASGKGPGILVLHAWWGLNEVFTNLCERLAKEGFVAFAPDLNNGQITTTRDEAQKTMETRDGAATMADAEAGLAYLQNHPAVTGKQLGTISFSMGGAYTTELDKAHPDAFKAIVVVYDDWAAQNFTTSKARFQFHFAENDEFVPQEYVEAAKGENAEAHIYPGTHHWFFEDNRPEDYKADAAKLVWERTVAFLKTQLA